MPWSVKCYFIAVARKWHQFLRERCRDMYFGVWQPYISLYLILYCLHSENTGYILFLKHIYKFSYHTVLCYSHYWAWDVLFMSLLLRNSFCPFRSLLKYHLFSEAYCNHLTPSYILSKYMFISFIACVIFFIFIYMFKVILYVVTYLLIHR